MMRGRADNDARQGWDTMHARGETLPSAGHATSTNLFIP